MSKTSTAVKRKYNEKAYERVPLSVKTGYKAIIKSRADSLHLSVNSYINLLIERDMKGVLSNGFNRIES